MLSTAVFTRLAHTHRGRMVGVVSGNDKLRARATLVVAGRGGATREDSLRALEAADGNPKVAIVMLRRGVHAEEARALLNSAGGDLKAGLAGGRGQGSWGPRSPAPPPPPGRRGAFWAKGGAP